MKKILIVCGEEDYSYSLLPYFLKYRIQSEKEPFHSAFYVGEVEKNIIQKNFFFNYKDFEFEIKFVKHGGIGLAYHLSDEQNLINVKNFMKFINSENYFKVIVLKEYNSFVKFYQKIENLEIVYFKADENFHLSDQEIENFLDNNKIISSASIGFSNKNFYFEPLINLFYFYYKFSFDNLSYDEIKNKKNNLLGLYYTPLYKGNRDLLFDKVKKIMYESIQTYPVVYDTKKDKPQFITLYSQINGGRWGFNHNAMYTDYINSVCGFIYDSLGFGSLEGPSDGKLRYYLNEKALKAIIFSKLNIPFIIDTNIYNFKILNEMGFWFLNSEFHSFNYESCDDNQFAEEMLLSIENSINYLCDVYTQNNKDLDKTHNFLKEKFGNKMENNYNRLIQYLENPPNAEKLINFIIN